MLAKQLSDLLRTEVAKANLQVEAPQCRFVEVIHQVGGGDKEAAVAFHLSQHFVYRTDLPAMPSVAPVLQKAVHLIEQQDRIIVVSLLKCPGEVLLGHSHIR